MESKDTAVLLAAIAVMSNALDALVSACTDKDGNAKPPSRGELMKARAMLPPSCRNALQPKADQPST